MILKVERVVLWINFMKSLELLQQLCALKDVTRQKVVLYCILLDFSCEAALDVRIITSRFHIA